MTTTTRAPSGQTTALPALWIGLGLTLLVGAYTLIDGATTHLIADHIRATYPSYGPAEVAAGVQAYVAMLLTVTGLGAMSWVATIWAARTGKRWTRALATAQLAVAITIAVVGLTTVDTSGKVGLAPAMGWLLLVPCLPGLAAVVKLWVWRGRR